MQIDELIYQHYESQQGPQRGHLGASLIGKDCEREIWYTFRQCSTENHSGRMLRLFETGHREEERIKTNLRAIGLEVWDQKDDGQQYGFSLLDGHFAGSVDGVIKGVPGDPETPHLLECKSSNDRAHKELLKKGVAGAKPVHYSQMQTYMGAMGLRKALYVSVNKNTDEIYIEIITFAPKVFDRVLEKARRVIESPMPLERVANSPEFYQCRWCAHKDLCWGSRSAQTNCRTCAHSTPGKDKLWDCGVHGVAEQTCSHHLLLPDLVPFATAVDSGDGWVQYRVDDGSGRQFLNVAGQSFPASDLPHYGSEELSHITNPAVIGDEAVELARGELGGEIVSTK